MRKLIGKLLLLGLFTISFFQANAEKALCDDCKACSGHYFVCQSENAKFESDKEKNCGPGTKITKTILEGC